MPPRLRCVAPTAAVAGLALLAAACSDTTGLPAASVTNVVDTVSLFALFGTSISSPSAYDLNGRLEYLGEKRLLEDVDALQAVRKERNRLAHEPGASCDWGRFGDDVSVIERSLLSLGLVRPTPQLEYFCERSAVEDSNEPGVSFSRRFSYGVKENGITALEVAWTQKFLAD